MSLAVSGTAGTRPKSLVIPGLGEARAIGDHHLECDP